MALIFEKINNELDKIRSKCFDINRIMDRGVSLLEVRWKMPLTAHILHPVAAHSILGDDFADSISKYQAERDNESVYLATPAGDKEYDSPLALFIDYHNNLLELESMTKDAVDMSIEYGDTVTKIFLDGFLTRLIPYISMSKVLVDLGVAYGKDSFQLQMLDVNIEKYIQV